MKLDSILDLVKKAGYLENTSANAEKITTKEKVNSVSYNREAGLYSGIEDVNKKKRGLMESFEELAKSDIETQKDYMAIMSNTLSRGDFNELMKEGYSLSDSEVEKIVTVVDKIKIKLAEAGVNTAYTKDVSLEAMERILGSKGHAYAVAKDLEGAATSVQMEKSLGVQSMQTSETKGVFLGEGAEIGSRNAAGQVADTIMSVGEQNVTGDMEVISQGKKVVELEGLEGQETAFGDKTAVGNVETFVGNVRATEDRIFQGNNVATGEFVYKENNSMKFPEMELSNSSAISKKFVFQSNGREMTEKEQMIYIAQELTNHDLPVTKENVNEVMKTLALSSEIGQLSDGAMKYVLANQLQPTVLNLYRAEFSSKAVSEKGSQGYYTDTMPGYYAKKPTGYNWQAIEGQMEKIIKQAGLEINEDTKEGAKWMVEHGVPLTEETIAKYMELKNISFPVPPQDMLKSIIFCMKDGKRPQQVSFSKQQDLLSSALQLQKKVESISDDALKNVILAEKEITIENLVAEQKTIDGNLGATFIYKSVENVNEDSLQLMTARRQLEEVRLMMTAEASLRMMKQGIVVETLELSRLVEELKVQENQYKQELFVAKGIEYTKEAGELYTETTRKVEALGKMPMYALGRFVASEENPTVNQVYEQGHAIKTTLEAAHTSYETMMTSPRKDMGDSIYKAFRNIDSILSDISIENTEGNVRAVKILAFNNMPISKENIALIKQADTCVNRLIRNMTGEVTLELIKRGKNPLDTDIYTLNEEVESIKAEIGASAEEKYSEFLWKTEKNQGITQEQRDAYIGIYRLFHQIEKSEGSVIGALVAQGAEVTLRNLITSVKTAKTEKSGGIRATVDDNFGGVSVVKTDVVSMEEQINSGFSQTHEDAENKNTYSQQQKQEQYYHTLVKQVLENIEPEKLSQVKNINNYNISLENFAEQLIHLPQNEEVAEQFYQEKMQQLKDARSVENNVIKMLMDFEQPVTVNNLVAADSLMNERGKMIKQLMAEIRKSPKKNKEKEIMDAAERVTDNLVSKEAAQAAYEALVDTEENFVEEAMEQEKLEYVDVRSLKLLHQEIKLTGALSKEENYEIPMNIKDEITSVNLKIIRGSNMDGNVAITMESEKYGKIAASFHVKGDRITGLLVSDTETGYEFLRSADKNIKLEMAGDTYRVTKLNYAKSDYVDLNQFTEIEKAEGESKVSTKALYQCAKAFIGIVKESA